MLSLIALLLLLCVLVLTTQACAGVYMQGCVYPIAHSSLTLLCRGIYLQSLISRPPLNTITILCN